MTSLEKVCYYRRSEEIHNLALVCQRKRKWSKTREERATQESALSGTLEGEVFEEEGGANQVRCSWEVNPLVGKMEAIGEVAKSHFSRMVVQSTVGNLLRRK